MAHSDTHIYREQLGTTYPRLGHALWEPTRVDVGDVGCIRDGKFLRLFNALHSESHPSNLRFGVPDYHEPLVPRVSDHLDNGTLKRGHYCSAGVKMTGGPESPSAGPEEWDVSYSSHSKRGGAVLYLPADAQRQDTLARRDFGRWMIKYIDSWLAFARRLGLGIEQTEEIILVTGCHRTRSWANVTFLEGHTDAQASFRIKEMHRPASGIQWQFSPLTIQGAMSSWGPEEGLTEDQSIFIRGYRVVRPFGVFPRQLRGAAGFDPSLDGDDDNDEDGLPLELIPLPCATMYRDPLHELSEYIANEAPDCDMVLVHDDDLSRIEGMCENIGALQPNAMMSLLQESKPSIIRHDVCKERSSISASNPETETEATTVAMSSNEFQKWEWIAWFDNSCTIDTTPLASWDGPSPCTDKPNVVVPPTPRDCPPTPSARGHDEIIRPHLPGSVPVIAIYNWICCNIRWCKENARHLYWKSFEGLTDIYMFSLLGFHILQATGSILNIRWSHDRTLTSGPYCTAQDIISQFGELGVALITPILVVYISMGLTWGLELEARGFALGLVALALNFSKFWVGIGGGFGAGIHRNYETSTPFWCWISPQYPGEYVSLWLAAFAPLLYFCSFFWLGGRLSVDENKWYKLKFHGVADEQRRAALGILLYPISYSLVVLPLSIARWSLFNHGNPLLAATFVGISMFYLSGTISVLLLWILVARPKLLLLTRPKVDGQPGIELDRQSTIRVAVSDAGHSPEPTGLSATATADGGSSDCPALTHQL